MDFVAIDFETANQHRSSACSLGITVVKDNVIVHNKEWRMRPEPFEFAPFNTQIHGISAQDVKDCPTFGELWKEIEPHLKNQLIVAHNTSFDISVLMRTLEHYQIPFPELKFLCTYSLSKALYPSLSSHRLNIICAFLGIPLEHHNASSDAMACAQILISVLTKNGFRTEKDLKKLCRLSLGSCSNSNYSPCRVSTPYMLHVANDDTAEDSTATHIDADFKDKFFVITGTLLSMTRDKAKEVITRGGGQFISSTTSKTDYLVVGIQDFTKLNGHTDSSKMRAAYALQKKGSPLRIIGEDEFVNMIDDELYTLCFHENKPSK